MFLLNEECHWGELMFQKTHTIPSAFPSLPLVFFSSLSRFLSASYLQIKM